ncbi:fucose-binding lectin II, partial [Klebsiella pneumoniae]|nr:fucose-binding lectin II [Klebsiella pneumoniae]
NLGIDTALAEKSDLATGVLSSSGYIKIPISVSGNSSTLILQWGTFTGKTSSSAGTDNVYENSSIYVTWPITFPTGVLQVITGGSSDVPGACVQEIAWNLAKTNTGATFGVSCREASASMSGSYIAIGY